MKIAITSLVAAFAALSFSYANCDSCAADAKQSTVASAACAADTLTHYLGVQESLAGDDLAGAKSEAKQLLASAKGAACPIEDKDTCAAIQKSSSAIASASSIKEARASFKGLSDALIAQLEKQGTASSKVYVMECPMAFGNKGGQWLQASAELKNPYFGASMLRCGMLQASIRAETLAACCAVETTAAATDSCASCAAEKS